MKNLDLKNEIVKRITSAEWRMGGSKSEAGRLLDSLVDQVRASTLEEGKERIIKSLKQLDDYEEMGENATVGLDQVFHIIQKA